MVTGKKVTIHAIILTIIVATVFIVENVQKEQLKKEKGPLFEEFKSDKIYAVTFTHKDSLITLNRVEGVWRVNNMETKEHSGYVADTLMVQKIFDRIPRLNRERPTASSKAAISKLKVNKEDGIHVSMYNATGKKVEEFYIGKKAEIWSNSYLKKVDEKQIYSVGENIRFAFSCDLLEWRQKKMIDVAKEEITFLHFNSVETGTLYIGQSPEKTWHFVGDTVIPIADTLMDGIFKEILSISAANWVYEAVPDTELGFMQPSLTLGFELNDGKKLAFIVGNKESDRPRYYVKSSDSPELFYMFNAKIRFMIDSFVRAKTESLKTLADAEETTTDSSATDSSATE